MLTIPSTKKALQIEREIMVNNTDAKFRVASLIFSMSAVFVLALNATVGAVIISIALAAAAQVTSAILVWICFNNKPTTAALLMAIVLITPAMLISRLFYVVNTLIARNVLVTALSDPLDWIETTGILVYVVLLCLFPVIFAVTAPRPPTRDNDSDDEED